MHILLVFIGIIIYWCLAESRKISHGKKLFYHMINDPYYEANDEKVEAYLKDLTVYQKEALALYLDVHNRSLS